jgi:tRNA (cytidine/uridine-2'-O-)-methyltransferase
MVAIALYQPDIPQNCGTILRLSACLGVSVHIIGPAGFDLSDKALRRAGMDYLDRATVVRHTGWAAFEAWRRQGPGRRLVLATTKADLAYTAFAFADGDILVFGRESADVPDEVHRAADARILIPMRPGLRSLNVATAAAMILGEALRQIARFPSAARRPELL